MQSENVFFFGFIIIECNHNESDSRIHMPVFCVQLNQSGHAFMHSERLNPIIKYGCAKTGSMACSQPTNFS